MRRIVALSGILVSLNLLNCANPALSFDNFQHEQQWIVDSIARDAAEMVLFASSQNGSDNALDLSTINFKTTESAAPAGVEYDASYTAAKGSITQHIQIAQYVWNPDNYVPLIKELTKKLEIKPVDVKTVSSDEFIQTMAECTGETLAEQNKKVSAELNAAPLDPNVQEKAALLCGIVALRDNAACFTDQRLWLNRMAAHLAMAKAFSVDSSLGDTGKLADIVMNSLGGREGIAITSIASLEPSVSNPAFKSWLRAMRVRITRDYRIADKDKGTFIERLEYGRALASGLDSDHLTDYLHGRKESPNKVEWMRLGFRGLNTVEAGHLYAEPGISYEVADFISDYARYHGGEKPDFMKAAPAKPVEAMRVFNSEPTRALVFDKNWKLEVVSWANMADFHSRHLLDAVFQRWQFEKYFWGVPDQAKSTLDYSEKMFSSLRLYPLLKADIVYETWVGSVRSKADADLADKLVLLITSHPELINGDLWWKAGTVVASKETIPDSNTWFVPTDPTGTGYDCMNRFDFHELALAQLEDLRKYMPYTDSLLVAIAKKKFGPHPTGDQYLTVLAPVYDYDYDVMKRIAEADKKDPQKHILRLERIVKIDPNAYFDLGKAYMDTDPEKARAAFQKGMELGRNEVQKANECGWLADYYLDHGQKDKALKLAEFAGDVYSCKGIYTLGWIYDRLGRTQDAEAWFIKAVERYDQNDGLCQFYLRHRNNPTYLAEGEKFAQKKFSHGYARVTPAMLKTPPEYGAKITTDSTLSRKYGLKVGAIVIAIDGYRIASQEEFIWVRNIDPRAPITEVIFWDGNQYHTVKASPPNRKFGIEMQKYAKG